MNLSGQAVTVKDRVRELILEGVRAKGGTTVADDESLFKSGAIDSLTMFKFIDLLETAFPVRIADHEMITDNFESINQIERFVTAKLAQRAEAE
ncbi:MAG: phosphopantetheine-binding protein [Candidatus Sulfotelmatobacter sp.]